MSIGKRCVWRPESARFMETTTRMTRPNELKLRLRREITKKRLRIARVTLRHNIADGEAHIAAWSCLKQLGRQPEADQEWSILQALLQSILKSGDGKSAKTAWFVVGLREEFFTLGALQLQSKEQHSVKEDGHYFSRIVAADESGKIAVLWFNIDTDIEMGNRAGEGHHIY